ATAISFFTLGVIHSRRADLASRAIYDAKLDALQAEVRSELGDSRRVPAVVPAGTSGHLPRAREGVADPKDAAARARMISDIKQQLQSEMGLLPVQLLRERRSSFVELYSYDTQGKTNYGTAGYLGHGYFVTVKHAVVALRDEDERGAPARKITAIKVVYEGKEIPAKLVDVGDADVEVHSGDWAIIKTKDLDLPALHVDTAFSYDFADP